MNFIGHIGKFSYENLNSLSQNIEKLKEKKISLHFILAKIQITTSKFKSIVIFILQISTFSNSSSQFLFVVKLVILSFKFK